MFLTGRNFGSAGKFPDVSYVFNKRGVKIDIRPDYAEAIRPYDPHAVFLVYSSNLVFQLFSLGANLSKI